MLRSRPPPSQKPLQRHSNQGRPKVQVTARRGLKSKRHVHYNPDVEDIYPNLPQWNAVALWAWDIVVDNCAICRNHIMDLCECSYDPASHPLIQLQALNVKPIMAPPPMKSVLLLGGFVMYG